ncbi:MAG: TolC family protein [Myxococcota bacterium]
MIGRPALGRRHAGGPWWAALVVLLLLAGPGRAGASPAPVLELDEVLDAVRRTHPKLEGAQRVVDQREALAFAARGGFDPLVTIRGKWAPVGYYSNAQVDALVQQATPLWGISAYAGYRLGLGSYPVYKGDLQTLSGGEVRAGINVPVWRNGPIDERRAKIRKTRIEQRGARLQLSATQLAVERDAAKTYWDWVAAGQSLEVSRALLTVAEDRNTGLTEQVAAGSAAPITLTDNQRLVLDRQAKVVQAQRKFQQATLKLSLYLRDSQRRPIRPAADRVPPAFPGPVLPADSVNDAVNRALGQRPDARALDAEREAARVDVRLTANRRGPAVDFQAFVAKDIGDGPAELGPAEAGVGVTVKMALPLRQARGEHRAAQAKVGQIDAKRRALRDTIEAEVREAYVSVEAATERVDLARAQRDAATQLADAERERLGQGASDLLAVNLRELAEAEAALLEIDALADYHRSMADLIAASGGA